MCGAEDEKLCHITNHRQPLSSLSFCVSTVFVSAFAFRQSVTMWIYRKLKIYLSTKAALSKCFLINKGKFVYFCVYTCISKFLFHKNIHIYHRRSTANLIFTSSHYLLHFVSYIYFLYIETRRANLFSTTTVHYTWNVSKFAFIDFSRMPCFRFYAFLEYLCLCIIHKER